MSNEQIHAIVLKSVAASDYLQQISLHERAALMHSIADEIAELGESLIQTAQQETGLPNARLQGEKGRTIGQWRSYANAIKSGLFAEARIDKGDGVQKADIRKYNKAVGPVAVFGASNFPFAFSTAGGDTASAIAAGCSVVYKEHPGHPATSQIMAEAIQRGLRNYGAPEGVFGYIQGAENSIGEALVLHPAIKAVAFTGSLAGGKALFNLGVSREEPIPVFAEMGSVNPVFALPEFLQQNTSTFAQQYVGSLSLGVGQFCTNPGVLVVQKDATLASFKQQLQEEIVKIPAARMLHQGIANSYNQGRSQLLEQQGVEQIGAGSAAENGQGQGAIYSVEAKYFIDNPILSHEVFGPAGLLVECENQQQMQTVLAQLGGQLTITFSATKGDMKQYVDLFNLAQKKCGRLLFGGMPTGVEVVLAMQHGGPFPSSTDSRFTSVGPDAIKRFLRPVSFQNWPDELLPQELQESNPLKIERIVDNKRELAYS